MCFNCLSVCNRGEFHLWSNRKVRISDCKEGYGKVGRSEHRGLVGSCRRAADRKLCVWFVVTGAPAMTSRGLKEKDFEQIAEFLERAVNITLKVQKERGKLLKEFNKGVENNEEIAALKADVEKFSMSFDMPGFDVNNLKYGKE